MNLSLRPVTDDDIEFGRETHHSAYHDVVVQQFGRWDQERQDGLFEQSWAAGPHLILLLDGAPCGYVGVDRHVDRIELRELVLQPEYQGRGIGSKFLRELQREARASGIPIRLEVLLQNRAHKLYTRLGFSQTGATDTHRQMKWR